MEKVINYIANHGSKDNPVCNNEISSSLKLSEASIRKKVNEARCKGIPICSCEKGYFISEEKTEILRTIQSLMHRTIAVEKAINGLLTVIRSGLEESQEC